MYRVELKDNESGFLVCRMAPLLSSKYLFVPNVPCGVESLRRMEHCTTEVFKESFLMYRVELKDSYSRT